MELTDYCLFNRIIWNTTPKYTQFSLYCVSLRFCIGQFCILLGHFTCTGVTNITMTSQWSSWHLKSPESRLFAQPFVQAHIKENLKTPRHWPLWGEPPVTGGFPHKWPVTRKIFPFDDVVVIHIGIPGMKWRHKSYYFYFHCQSCYFVVVVFEILYTKSHTLVQSKSILSWEYDNRALIRFILHQSCCFSVASVNTCSSQWHSMLFTWLDHKSWFHAVLSYNFDIYWSRWSTHWIRKWNNIGTVLSM